MCKIIIVIFLMVNSLLVLSLDYQHVIPYGYYNNKDIETVITELSQKVTVLNSKDNYNEWVSQKRLLANAYSKRGFYKLGTVQLEELLILNKPKLDSVTQAIVNLELGNIYKWKGEHGGALKCYLIAKDILKLKKEWGLFMQASITLAELYRKIGKYDKAEEQLDIAFDNYETHNLSNLKLYMNGIGRKAAICNERGKGHESIKHSTIVLNYAVRTKNVNLQAVAHNEIGYSYLNLRQPDTAIMHYTKAEELWLSSGAKIDAAQAKYNKAVCFARNTNDRDSTRRMFYNLAVFVNESKIDYALYDVYHHIFTEYARIKNYDSAFVFQEKYFLALQKFRSKEAAGKIAEIQESYQNAKILNEKEQVETELKLSNTEVREKGFQTVMISIFSLLIVILFLVLLRFFVVKRKSHNLLEVRNEEKDMLIREVHHRVKNNLQFVNSILNMQLSTATSEDGKNVIKDASRRIYSMSLVHEMLYNKSEVKDIDMKKYFDQLINSLSELVSSNDTPVQFKVNVVDIELSSSLSTSLGIIASELISNAIKYAFGNTKNPEIKLSLLELKEHEFVFIVKDNGVGGLNENNTGLGMRMIDIFSRQIKGEYSFNDDNGVTFELKFKK